MSRNIITAQTLKNIACSAEVLSPYHQIQARASTHIGHVILWEDGFLYRV
jgi:hypothetical protein